MIKSNNLQWLHGEARDFVALSGKSWLDASTGKQIRDIWAPVSALQREITLDKTKLSKASKRLPGEALIQGEKISPYGDNAVTNIQWDVEIGAGNWDQLDPSHSKTSALNRRVVRMIEGSAPQYCTLDPVYKVWIQTSDVLDIVENTFNSSSYSYRRYRWDEHVSDDGTITVNTRAVYLRRFNHDGTGTAVWMCQFHGVDVYYPSYDEQRLCAASYGVDNIFTKLGKWSSSLWNQRRNDADFIASLPLADFLSPGPRNSTSTRLRRSLKNGGKSLYGASFDIPDETIKSWQSKALALMREVPTFTDKDRSELAASCLDQVNYFDGNMMAFLGDMSKVGDSIKSVLNLVKNADSAGQWASSWLSLRFGDRLQIADTSSLIAGARKWAADVRYDHNTYRARKSLNGSCTTDGVPITYKQYLTAEIDLSSGLLGDLENLLAAPYRWDLVPSLANVWDLIPFSFVVDWFYDVQSILEQIDRMHEYGLLDIKAQMSGYKRSVSMSLADVSDNRYKGKITYRYYSRSKAPVQSWLRLNPWTDYAPLSVRPVNVLDGASLLIQYAK